MPRGANPSLETLCLLVQNRELKLRIYFYIPSHKEDLLLIGTILMILYVKNR